MSLPRRLFWSAGSAIVLALGGGCSPAYVTQAVTGQLEIAGVERPVDDVLNDARTTPELRRSLAAAKQVLRYAHEELGLPDNGSYRQFAALDRPYVVWNVFVAPEFSLELHTWCFPVAGCVGYRGYFDEKDAQQFAAGKAAQGSDVAVRGALAYSTLGFFRDPLLSTVVHLPPADVAGLVFHELAHQRIYVAGDTAFNESFATLVEQEGTIRWLEVNTNSEGLCAYLVGLQREREVYALLEQARARLKAVYASKQTEEARRKAKEAELTQLRERYRQLRAQWHEPPYFDGWFRQPLNNAALAAIAAYRSYVGQLRVILDSEGGDLERFYRRVERLARLTAAERAAVLGEITDPTDRQPGAGCPGGPG